MPEMMLIFIRSVMAFIVLLIIARIMGKKQLSQLTFFDYVVGITIGNISGSLAVDQNLKMTNGLIGLVVWGSFAVIMSLVSLKSLRFRQVTDGQPTVVVKNGKIQEKNLKKLRMPIEDLMPLLRSKNAFKLSDVELAVMELSGDLSVMKKTDAEPITPKVLGMQMEQEKQPQIVLHDGKVLENSLNKTGYTREWLLGEVQKQGADSFQDVFLAQIDSKGNVYVDLYADQMKQPQAKQKPLVQASLKKVQADLESFALQTKDEKTKRTYEEQAKQLQQLVDKLDPYMKE